MLKRYRGENFIIRHSFLAYDKPVVIELPAAKELAKHLRKLRSPWQFDVG
jgi:hypothetical protein